MKYKIEPRKRLYIDVDGLFANFEGTYLELEPKYDKDMTWHDMFLRMVKEETIFERLDPMPNAYALYQFLKDIHFDDSHVSVELLTAMGTTDHTYHPLIQRQKLNWLHRMGFDRFHVNFSSSGERKRYWAEKEAFLLDDMDRNVQSFIFGGGKGHTYHDSKLHEAQDAIIEFLEY